MAWTETRPVPDFRVLFESAPGLYLVLMPDLTIVAVSDAYLRATMTRREDILGRGLFEVFPDNPDDPAASGVRNLKASLDRVHARRATDTMAVQKYDIRRPESEGGGFEERYWSPVNSPVLNAAGEMEYIIHQVEDVTEFVRLRQRGDEQQKLLEAAGLLRNVVESSDDAIITQTLTGVITSWNPGAERLFGFSAQEALGQSMRMLIPSDKAYEEPQILAQMAGGDTLNHFETVRGRKSGERIDISATISPIKDERGRIIGASQIARDITARKLTEHALRLSDERTRLIVESALDAVVTMDRAGVISGWSAQAESTFGWKREEALGRTLSDTIIPERYRAAHREGLKRFLETGKTRVLNTRVELCALHRDGHEFPVELAITPLRAGEDMAFSAFVRDITERKRAEQALAESEARFRTLAESLPHLVWTCRPDGWCDYLSRQWLEYTGREHGSQVGYGWAEQLHPEDRQRAEREWASASVQGRCFDIEFRIRRHDGVYRWFKTRAVPLRNEAGEIVKWFGSNTDFEDLKQSEARLQQAYDDLRRTQQALLQQERLSALGQMASGIAHDINNAISPVTLYTESLLAREPHLSPEGRRYLEIIQRAIDDVTQTVARMREFYRPREPQMTLASVDLNRLVEQVLDLTRARWSDMAHQRGIAIEVKPELTPALPAIMGAESEIRDALTNLIFNAIDAMPQGGTLSLRTTSAAGVVRLEIGDTGIGMDEDTRRRCLEPFFTTKGERGTGLGLAMVYGVMQRHSAEIDVESAPGRGTTIRLTFAAPTTMTVVVQPPTVSSLPAALRILIVDDDPMLLKSLSDTLQADGHTLTVTDGGEAGIKAFRAAQGNGGSFDLVITDLGMPYVDGRKVASAVKTLVPSMPVILLTGWGQRLVTEGDIPPHVDRVLSKPPKLRELREALAALTSAGASGS
jgi:PAS domain S-box-containing protein